MQHKRHSQRDKGQDGGDKVSARGYRRASVSGDPAGPAPPSAPPLHGSTTVSLAGSTLPMPRTAGRYMSSTSGGGTV